MEHLLATGNLYSKSGLGLMQVRVSSNTTESDLLQVVPTSLIRPVLDSST